MAQVLHHNEFGYCARCPRTPYLHVCFGNIALALTADEFEAFRKQVAEAHRQPQRRTDAEKRCIALRTPADRMAMVFTPMELQHLFDILEHTALQLEIEALLGRPDCGC